MAKVFEVFEGYNSQVDWPGAAVWRETSVAFLDAKVLHLQRPEDEWWNSRDDGKFSRAGNIPFRRNRGIFERFRLVGEEHIR